MNDKSTINVTCRALVNAVKEESTYDYDQHGDSWQWAINEMSEEVNDVWAKNMGKIYDLAILLDKQLKTKGL